MSNHGRDVREPDGLASEWHAPTSNQAGQSPSAGGTLAPWSAVRSRWYAPARRNGRYIGAAVVLTVMGAFWSSAFCMAIARDPSDPLAWVLAVIALVSTGLTLWGAISNARKP